MKTVAAIHSVTRPAVSMAFLGLFAIAAIGTSAEANNCGVRPVPKAQWGMPTYRPMPHQSYGNFPHWQSYGKHMRAGGDVIDIAKRSGEFGTLLTAVRAAGLTGLLEGRGPYTLFAPTDSAFEKLPEGTLQELLADKEKLTEVLKYHVVPGRISALQILEKRELSTAAGQPLQTRDLSVVRADIQARNGVIHVIDAVILPSS